MQDDVELERVGLAELLGALSLAIDLGFGQPMEHVLRQCRIALRIADHLGHRAGPNAEYRAAARHGLEHAEAEGLHHPGVNEATGGVVGAPEVFGRQVAEKTNLPAEVAGPGPKPVALGPLAADDERREGGIPRPEVE